MSRDNGVADDKLLEIHAYATSARYTERERLALEYAEQMTQTSLDVDDELFARVSACYTAEEIIELTCTVAFENFLSKFHRALRVDTQGFCPIRIPLVDPG